MSQDFAESKWLAAVYLLAAHTELWMQTSKAIWRNLIDFASIKLKDIGIKDFINLTFCCQQATVITDFSNLEAIGRAHYMNLHGGCASSEELADLDSHETALLLIDSGEGIVTPYGVAYDNGMKLEQVYNGRQFPAYFHDDCVMMVRITPQYGVKEDQNPEYLYLPASEHRIERAMLRAGIDNLRDVDLSVEEDNLPQKVSDRLHLEREGLDDLNAMCLAIQRLEPMQREKLEAAEQPDTFSETFNIAILQDDYEYVPDDMDEYRKQVLCRIGADDEIIDTIDGFMDFAGLGRMSREKETIRVAGNNFPQAVVKSRLLKLDREHILFVFDCLKENTTQVRNMKQYLLTALYNAPATIENHYAAQVNHNLYGDKVAA